MESVVVFSIVICSAIVIGGGFFWCTYRHQVEPVEGRKTEDQLNAMYAAQIIQEIEMAHKENSEEKDDI